MPVGKMEFLLCLQLSILEMIAPHGTCPSLPYYGSGHLLSVGYRFVGAILGLTLHSEHPSLNNLAELR